MLLPIHEKYCPLNAPAFYCIVVWLHWPTYKKFWLSLQGVSRASRCRQSRNAIWTFAFAQWCYTITPLWLMRVFESTLFRNCSTVSEIKLCTALHIIVCCLLHTSQVKSFRIFQIYRKPVTLLITFPSVSWVQPCWPLNNLSSDGEGQRWEGWCARLNSDFS